MSADDMLLGEPTMVERPADDDELGHIYCCEDETIGLCGTRLWNDADPDTPVCVVCIDLEENDYDACPRGGRCCR